MGLNLEKLAEALKVSINFTPEDRIKFKEMRESGRYGFNSAREELIAGKILKRITELVEKIDGETKSDSSGC